MDITSKIVNDTGGYTQVQMDGLRLDLFRAAWARLPWRAQYTLRVFAKHPTERNNAYVTGYLGAMRDCQVINANDYTYWLAAIGQMVGATWLKTALLDQVDGPETSRKEL